MIEWLNKRVKKMDVWDVGLVKLSVAAFVLFIITIWPAVMTLVQSVNPWWFLLVTLIVAIRPLYRVYLKNDVDDNNPIKETVVKEDKKIVSNKK